MALIYLYYSQGATSKQNAFQRAKCLDLARYSMIK